MYHADGGENPGTFTVVGILVTLLLGASVFSLLYIALAAPDAASVGVLPPLATATPALIPSPAPPITVAPATAAAAVESTSPPTTEPSGTVVPTLTPSLTSTPAPSTPTARPSPTRVVTLRVASNGLGLNVRRLPSLTSGIIERLPDGSAVRDLGETRRTGEVQWRRVRTQSGTNGWASADLLQPAP